MKLLSWITDISEIDADVFDRKAEAMADFLGYDSDDYWDSLKSNLSFEKYGNININYLYRDLFSYAAGIISDNYEVDEDIIDWYVSGGDSYFMINTKECNFENKEKNIEDFLIENKIECNLTDDEEEEEE